MVPIKMPWRKVVSTTYNLIASIRCDYESAHRFRYIWLCSEVLNLRLTAKWFRCDRVGFNVVRVLRVRFQVRHQNRYRWTVFWYVDNIVDFPPVSATRIASIVHRYILIWCDHIVQYISEQRSIVLVAQRFQFDQRHQRHRLFDRCLQFGHIARDFVTVGIQRHIFDSQFIDRPQIGHIVF